MKSRLRYALLPSRDPALRNIGLPGQTSAPSRDGFVGGRSLFACALASALGTILTSLTIEGRERVSSAEALVQNADFLGFQIGELQMDMGDRQIEEVEGPSLEQLAIEADMFMP